MCVILIGGTKMYILIFEDGEIKKSDGIASQDLESCDAGYLSIIDISNPCNPREYYAGAWIALACGIQEEE